MPNKILYFLMTVLLSLTLPAYAYSNSIGMEFANIPAGCFQMGRDSNFEEGGDDELPQHKVCLNAYQMATTEVTQAQWVKIMGNNPSKFKGRTNPVEKVSWQDAKRFVKRSNQAEGTSKYRLPSEAQWEYAARAGSTTAYSFGDDKGGLGQTAWYDGNSGDRTHPVGEKSANKWGLQDMHGNVWEWVEDCYHKNYRGAPSDGSVRTSGCEKNSKGDAYRVIRGGGWVSDAYDSRSARRFYDSPGDRFFSLGFRLVRRP